jgi:hypothetical protein
MKKSILSLEGVEVLSRNVQKRVTGGNRILSIVDAGSCTSTCSSNSDCPQRGSACSTYECDKNSYFKQCSYTYTE